MKKIMYFLCLFSLHRHKFSISLMEEKTNAYRAILCSVEKENNTVQKIKREIILKKGCVQLHGLLFISIHLFAYIQSMSKSN